MAGEEDPLKFTWTSEGDEALKRTLDDINRRLSSLERTHKTTAQAEGQHRVQTEQLNRSLAQTGTAAQSAQLRLSSFGSVLGLAAQGVGAMSTSSGRLVAILGQATGAVTTMSAVLGPWGVALGLATTAFSLLTNSTDRQTSAIRRQTTAIRNEAIPALGDYVSAIQRGIQRHEQFMRVQQGLGSVIEQRAAVEQEQARIGNLPIGSAARELAEARLQAAQERLEQARARQRASGGTAAESAADVFSNLAEQRNEQRRGGGGGGRAERSFAVGEAQARGVDAFLGPRQGAAPDLSSGRTDADLMGRAAGDDLFGDLARGGGGAFARGLGPSGLDDKGLQDIADGYALAADQAERLRDVTAEFGDIFATVTQKVVDGEMSLGKAIFAVTSEKVKARGYEMIASGTAHLLEGAALAIALPLSPQGEALAAVGAIELAKGAAFVAGGALAASAGNAIGGGGGGGRGRSGGTQRARPEGPAPDSRSGGNTYVVNINDAAVLMGQPAEVGLKLRDALRQAEQRYGGV